MLRQIRTWIDIWVMGGWRTGDTAPKDGSPVWLYREGVSNELVAGFWNEKAGWWTQVGYKGPCFAGEPDYWRKRGPPPAPPPAAVRAIPVEEGETA